MEIKAGDSKRGALSRKPYRVLAVAANSDCELIRWQLERACVPYQARRRAPCLPPGLGWLNGGPDAPLLVSSEATFTETRQALEYIDARLPPDLRLYPRTSGDRAETEHLLDLFLDTLGVAVRGFFYAYLLPHEDLLVPVMTAGIPLWQRLVVANGYPLIRSTMTRSIPAGTEWVESYQQRIEQVFVEVNFILYGGGPYLLGKQISIADLCFAAMAAPVLYPDQYGGSLPAFDQLPASMRDFCADLRATRAGEFALALYRDYRPYPQPPLNHHPASTMPENTLSYAQSRLLAVLTGPPVQRGAFALLRKHKPVLVFGKKAVITRDRDVRDALARNTELTIAEINSPSMLRLNGPFFLGMDSSEQYTREQGDTRKVIRSDEGRLIHDIVRRHCDDLISAAWLVGRIDMVSQLSRPVAARFIGDYFGVPGPHETKLMHWMRALFHDLFINLSNDREIRYAAEQSYHELAPYLLALIAERKQQIRQGYAGEDFLSRMIGLQLSGQISLDDDGIRRNISGLIVGALDTTSKVSTLIVEQLLNHPEWLEQARSVVDDEQAFRHLCFDVLRFDTMASVMRRYSRNGVDIAGVHIPQGCEVFIATASAMFDEEAWLEPYRILTDRPLDRYLHFGDGMHRCFGEYINRIQIPLIVASLVRLPNLRKHSALLYDGPFPDQFVLAFDR